MSRSKAGSSMNRQPHEFADSKSDRKSHYRYKFWLATQAAPPDMRIPIEIATGHIPKLCSVRR